MIPHGTQSAAVTVTAVHYQGAVTRLNTVTPTGESINVSAGSQFGRFEEGEALTLTWQPDALHVMAGES